MDHTVPSKLELASKKAEREIRPWGELVVLENAANHRILKIKINPGHRQSLKMHHHRRESFVVLRGVLKLTLENREALLHVGEIASINPCNTYRLENPGVIPLEIVETITGEYLEPDDVIRFADDYARTSNS